MKIYHSHRAEPYFTFLKNGQKTVECRVRKGKYGFVQPGDEIVVYNEEETDRIHTRVKRVTSYPTFKKMLEVEELRKVLPNVDSVDQAVEIYRGFYTPDQEKEFGVVAIEVKVKS